jgi:5-methyltetrahydrofolate--homocysteine methyltransferase
MQHVASEMQRDDFFRVEEDPAADRRRDDEPRHTAVKIAPHYDGPGRLRSRREPLGRRLQRAALRRARRRLRRRARGRLRARCARSHASKKATPLVTLAEARANKTPVDWAAYTPPAPKFIGRRVLKNQDLAEIAEVIDWGPFFQTWDLAGPLSGDPHRRHRRRVGAPRALRRQADAASHHRGPLAERQRRRRPVSGGERRRRRHRDLRDDSRSEVLMTWRGLRMQSVRPGGRRREAAEPLPRRLHRAQGLGQGRLHRPVRGAPPGLGVEKKERQFAADLDDYSAIMLKALADRSPRRSREPAPARAHRPLGLRARRVARRSPTSSAERYRGIRPAPGYPACPDHRVKRELFACSAPRRSGCR